MAELILKVEDNGKLNDGDMLIYKDGKFVAVKKEHILSDIPKLKEEIKDLKKKIKYLELVIRYDHGEIDETEFEKLCLGLKK